MLILQSFFALFCVVCLGLYLSAVRLLLCLGCPCCGWPLSVCFSGVFLPWCCRAPLFCCCSLVLVLLFSPFLCDLAAWVLAVGPTLSWLPPFPPLGCSLVLSGPVSPAGPSLRVSGCICNGPVVIPLAWRVVADWLVSSLRFMAIKASALCGALPLHHAVGVVYVPLAAALKYSPLGDPESS